MRKLLCPRTILGASLRGIFFALIGPGVFPLPLAAQEVPITCTEPTDLNISYGTSVICFLETPGDIDIFRFQGNVGDDVSLRATRTSGTGGDTCIELLDPLGVAIDTQCLGGASTIIRPTLSASGMFTALVSSSNPILTFDYALVLERTFPVSPASQAIQYDDVLSRILDFSGDIDLYDFFGASGDRIILNVIRTSGTGGTPCVEISDPFGVVIDTQCGPSNFVQIEPTLIGNGRHAFSVFSSNPGLSFSYNTTLLCVLGPCPGDEIFSDGFESGSKMRRNTAASERRGL